MSLSEYMEQALVEAMRFDIEEGNLSDALLEKVGGEDSKKDNFLSFASPAPNLMNSDLDLLKSCRHRYLRYIRFCNNCLDHM